MKDNFDERADNLTRNNSEKTLAESNSNFVDEQITTTQISIVLQKDNRDEEDKEKENQGVKSLGKLVICVKAIIILKIIVQVPCFVYFPEFLFSLIAELASFCAVKYLIRKLLNFSLILTILVFCSRFYLINYLIRKFQSDKIVDAAYKKAILALLILTQIIEITQACFTGGLRTKILWNSKVFEDQVKKISNSKYF